ncbi:hypothetical protein K7432_015274 [Basidiobolus ranarum]|uniref:Lysophospholipid acyltransferase 5 n=1 Tax=Basidiobolus ranarum TaxID=34480 RepID=A0ABR2WGE3_9FUNG
MDALSSSLGIPLSTLKLLGTIVLAYPAALVYRFLYLHPIKSPRAQEQRNLYIVVVGLALSFFFSGTNIIHSLITVSFTWTTCKLLDKCRGLAVVICFLFNTIYLLGGYYSNSLQTYDITWTMPQCILCLRMLGLSWDFYDGRKVHKVQVASIEQRSDNSRHEPDNRPALKTSRPPSKTPASFTDTALPSLPSYLEILGYSYFFGSFLIGPQFSFSLYKRFLNLQHLPKGGQMVPYGSYTRAIRCFFVGVFYLAIQQLIGAHYPAAYMVTEKFGELSFISRFAYMWMAGKFVLNKYLGVWSLNEGSGALCGFSINEYDQTGTPRWDSLANVDVYKYETATSLTQIIESFNLNTNLWSKYYIFKRLKFMGNKHISTFFTLFFLALWHGVHPGYFICFASEFIDVMAERIGAQLLAPYVKWMYVSDDKSMKTQICRRAHQAFTWFLTTSALYYAIIPFELLQLRDSIIAWGQVYFIGTLVVLGLIAVDVIKTQIPTKRKVKSEKVL